MAALFRRIVFFFQKRWRALGLPPVLASLRGKEEPLLRLCCSNSGFSIRPVFFAAVPASRLLDFLSRKVPPCDGYMADTNDSEIQSLSDPEWLGNPSLLTPVPPTS